MRDCAYYVTDSQWKDLKQSGYLLTGIYNEYAPINGLSQPYGEAIVHVLNGTVLAYSKGNNEPYVHKLLSIKCGIMSTY